MKMEPEWTGPGSVESTQQEERTTINGLSSLKDQSDEAFLTTVIELFTLKVVISTAVYIYALCASFNFNWILRVPANKN